MFFLRIFSVAALGAAVVLAGCAHTPSAPSDASMPSAADSRSRCLSNSEIEQWAQAYSARQPLSNPPEGMIIQSGEMHGFYDVANRVKLYTEMLKFFDRHIGGTVTVSPPSKAD